MSKTVLFETIQFSIQKLFYIKQFSLAYVRSLNVKQLYFKQFSLALGRSSDLFDPLIGSY